MRSFRALGPGLFVGAVLVVSGGCGGNNNAAPSNGAGVEAGAPQSGPSGLPCDVDAVLAKNCRTCHSSPPQYGAPMPLMTWENLQTSAVSDGSKKVYELIPGRIGNDAKPMPPPPNERLSAGDRKTLSDWVVAGAPRSSDDCGTTAAPPTTGLDCTPDLSLAAASAYEMPADAGDQYVCFGVDLSKEQATHITAFFPKIDNTTITHHLVVYESPTAHSPTPTPCDAGSSIPWRMVLGWAPGVKPLALPPDVGFPISTDASAPTHYVVQMHYSNPQKLSGQKDKSSIELCSSPPRKYEADVMAFGSQKFTIPQGNTTIDCAITVPAPLANLHVFAAMPHMHKLGVAMSTKLTPAAGGADVDLGTMPSFSFDSQAWVPIQATSTAGDVIHTRCSWVNNTGEPVGFGEKTADEMCYSFTMYYPRVKSNLWSWALPAAQSKCTSTP